MRVSVLIPVYNEAANVIRVLESVRQQQVDGVEFEIVVVDDGSKDRSVELMEARPELYDRLVKLPYNRGKGGAVKAGLAAVTGDYVLFQDADLEYHPSDYPALMRPAKDFGAEVVMGSRMVAPPYTRVYYFWHKVGNAFITLFFNVLNNTTFTDVYSCYLMFRRPLLEVDKLRSEGWEQHAEILTKVVRRARVLYEVPISYQGRTYEEGKKIRAHHAIGILLMMLRERLFPTQ